jgi:ring-1,2-phenylacetyl-CoA epoxidase subunit PaaA
MTESDDGGTPGPSSDGPIGSARSLLLTVLGDVVLPAGGRARLGALTEAMAALGVTPEATRQALRRLVAQDLVVAERTGRLSAYQISSQGRRRLEEAADRIYLRRPLAWDGRWRMLRLPAGEHDRAARTALRRELAWLGYGRLSGDLWICPWDLGARRDAALAKHDVTGSVETFTAALDGDDRTLAAEAYDLEELAAAHRVFLDRYEADLPQPPDDREAFVARIELVHRWRRFLFLDPGLPTDLLPTSWLGQRAAETFRACYRAVERPAWACWDQMAAAADPHGTAPTHVVSNLDVPAGDVDMSSGPRGGEAHDPGRTQEFLDRLHAGRKIEPSDWMPSTYRELHIKFIEMHANSEIMGALPEREWIARAPTLKRKRSLAAKVQDEVGHAHLIYRVAESLGKPRQQMYEDLIAGRGSFHNVFHYPTYSWGDVACIGFLVDGAAIVTQRALLETSYAPYVRVMRRVVAEESLHYRHGEDIMLALASGTDAQFEMLQEAVNRWWEPVMHFFGTDVAAEDDPMIHWGVKTRTNEQSRQEWIGQYVSKLWDMGIETPDPELAYDPAAKAWTYTEPDWDRLRAIVKGEPTEATATRRYWRQVMHRNHAWVHQIVTGDAVPVAA